MAVAEAGSRTYSKFDTLPLGVLADGSPDPDSIEPAIATLKAEGVQFIYLGSSAVLEKETDRFTGAAVAAGAVGAGGESHIAVQGSRATAREQQRVVAGKIAKPSGRGAAVAYERVVAGRRNEGAGSVCNGSLKEHQRC